MQKLQCIQQTALHANIYMAAKKLIQTLANCYSTALKSSKEETCLNDTSEVIK